MIYTNEITYVFEAERDAQDGPDGWGYAFIVTAQGAVGEAEVHDFQFDLSPQLLPVDRVRVFFVGSINATVCLNLPRL